MMINIIESFALCFVLIGIAGTAGQIEMNQSPVKALIILTISIIVILLCEGKNKCRR